MLPDISPDVRRRYLRELLGLKDAGLDEDSTQTGMSDVSPDLRVEIDEAVNAVLTEEDYAAREVYCGPVMRHPAAPLQAANFSSAI